MYNPSLLKPYLKAKYNNKITVKNQELYYLCGCENDNQKGSVRALKSQLFELFKNESNSETSETKTSKNYTPEEVKDRFHEQSKKPSNHVLSLIKQYFELPLFIYSKLYNRIQEEYKQFFNKVGDINKSNYKNVDYSFFDMYIELYEDINKGVYDKEIEEYMKDIIQSYGNTFCQTYWNKPFDKEKLEEVTYWSEEYAKEWLDKQLLENPKYCKDYNLDLEKENERDRVWASKRVEEGSYDADYSEELNRILDVIANLMTFMEELVNIDNYYCVRSQLIHYLMFDYCHFNHFDNRLKEYIKTDIIKYFIDVKRHGNYPLFCNALEELYDEYDNRFSDKLDYAEDGLNYKGQHDHLFEKGLNGSLRYKSEEPELTLTEPEMKTPKQEIINKTEHLESELNRLKNGNLGNIVK